MQYNFKLFIKSFYKSFFKSRGTHAHLTHKRFGFLVLFYIVWPIWGFIVWFTFMLDNVFFKEYSSQPIDKPLFITGNFRSGSTYLQRLIAKDKKQFASARTWDIFLSPSITLTKLFSAFLTLDRLVGNPIKKAFKKFDQRTLGQVDIHKISFFEPEEDENFLLHNWSSFFGGILFPFMEDYEQYCYFDQELSDKDKSSIMHFYRRMIERFLFARGGNHRLLSKNPSLCPKIGSIYKEFPSAKIVYLVRNPLEMLPSTISWLAYTWRVFSDPLIRYPFTQEILQFSKHWYEYPLKVLANTNPQNYIIIKYDDLVSEPENTVNQIYNHFGYEMSSEFKSEIARTVQNAKNFRSRHHYALEDMGFTHLQVLETYADIFDRFGFDTNIDGISPAGKESTLD